MAALTPYNDILRRADLLVPRCENGDVPSVEEVEALAIETRNLQNVTSEEKDRVFLLMATFHQWMAANDHRLAGRVAQVPPHWAPAIEPILVEEVLPAPRPAPAAPQPGHQAPPQAALIAQVAPALLAELAAPVMAAVAPPQPAAAPAVAAPVVRQAAPAQAAAAPQPAVAQPAPEPVAGAREPTLWEKITAIFTRCMNAIRDFISTYLWCTPRPPQAVVQPPAIVPPPAPAQPGVVAGGVAAGPAAPAPAVPNANADAAPAPAVAEARVEPDLFDAEHPQKAGRFRGTMSLAQVGGPAVRFHCTQELLVQLWRSVTARENLSVPGRSAELIDNSLRQGAAKQARGEAFPEIQEVGVPLPAAEPLPADRWQATRRYHEHIQALTDWGNNNEQPIIAAILGKGDQMHGILIDRRNRDLPRYYHYNPHAEPAAIEIRGQAGSFSHFLSGDLLMDANGPRFQAFILRPVNG